MPNIILRSSWVPSICGPSASAASLFVSFEVEVIVNPPPNGNQDAQEGHEGALVRLHNPLLQVINKPQSEPISDNQGNEHEADADAGTDVGPVEATPQGVEYAESVIRLDWVEGSPKIRLWLRHFLLGWPWHLLAQLHLWCIEVHNFIFIF